MSTSQLREKDMHDGVSNLHTFVKLEILAYIFVKLEKLFAKLENLAYIFVKLENLFARLENLAYM